MTREELLALLRQQRSRGPLPASPEHLSAWVAALAAQFPAVRVEVPHSAVSPLRAVGIVVDEIDGKALARFAGDGDALDRLLALVGHPPIAGGAAAALISAIERAQDPRAEPPRVSLPLRIQPAKASSLGWSSDLFSLTVLVSNVALRENDGALLPQGPVVAVCAEYDRPLTSLDPPSIAGYGLSRARAEGVPMLKLPAGFLRTPLRLESTSRLARAPAGRPEAMARATRFLDDLGQAWQRRIGSVLEVAWPVYRPEGKGALLDAVVGRPLPEMQLS